MSTPGHAEAQLRTEVVEVLTRAAEYAQAHPNSFDYADFLARALSDTAVAVGGAQRLVGDRPESWEAHHVAALTWTYSETTIDHGPTPVVVPVNVAELVESGEHHPGLLGLDAAIDRIGDRYANITSDADLDAWDDEIVAIEERYAREYRSYVDRFDDAAQAASEQLGLTSGVYIAADTHPGSGWWTDGALTNPRVGVNSSIVCALWNFAHDTTQLPNVDLAYNSPAEQHHLSRGA